MNCAAADMIGAVTSRTPRREALHSIAHCVVTYFAVNGREGCGGVNGGVTFGICLARRRRWLAEMEWVRMGKYPRMGLSRESGRFSDAVLCVVA